MDLVSNISQYADENIEDVSLRVRTYMKKEGIDRAEVDKYIGEYPERIYKNMYKMRIFALPILKTENCLKMLLKPRLRYNNAP